MRQPTFAMEGDSLTVSCSSPTSNVSLIDVQTGSTYSSTVSEDGRELNYTITPASVSSNTIYRCETSDGDSAVGYLYVLSKSTDKKTFQS